MAVITSTTGGGNWSAGGTWVGGVAPTPGTDTAVINGPVTVDASVTVGTNGATGTAAITCNTGKSLTIATGVTLTLRGDWITTASTSSTQVMQAGSALVFNPPDGSTYKCSLGNAQKLAINSGGGARCSISTVKQGTTGGNGYFTGSGQHSCLVTCKNTDFSKIGDGTNPAFIPRLTASGPDSFTFDNCTFDLGGAISANSDFGGDAIYSLTNCVWTNTVPASVLFGGGVNVAITTGTRLIQSCVFDKNAIDPSTGYMNDFTIDRCYFGAALDSKILANKAWAGLSNSFIRLAGPTNWNIGGDVTNCYFYCDVDGGTTTVTNPHYFGISNLLVDLTVDKCVFDASNITNIQGDSALWGGSPSSTRTIRITRNLVLLDMVNGIPCCAIASHVASNGNWAVTVDHNTYYTSSNSSKATELGCKFADSNSSAAATIASMQGNLAYSVNTGGNHGPKVSVAVVGAPTDTCSPANADYNAGYNTLATTTALALTNQGKGYWANWSTTGYGTNDLDIVIGNTDPNFADPNRRLSTWGTSVGQSGSPGSATLVNNTLTYLQGDPTNRIVALLSWVKEGYRPRAAEYTAFYSSTQAYPTDSLTTDANGNSLLGTIGACGYIPPSAITSAITLSDDTIAGSLTCAAAGVNLSASITNLGDTIASSITCGAGAAGSAITSGISLASDAIAGSIIAAPAPSSIQASLLLAGDVIASSFTSYPSGASIAHGIVVLRDDIVTGTMTTVASSAISVYPDPFAATVKYLGS